MMKSEVGRLKQDLHIIEQALAAQPRYGRRHVGMHLGLGVAGTAAAALALVPAFRWIYREDGVHITVTAASLFLVLLLGLPVAFSRLLDRGCFPLPSLLRTGARDMDSVSLNTLGALLAAGIALLLRHFGAPAPLPGAAALWMAGMFLLVSSWGRPMRQSGLAYAFAFVALGGTLPFLPGPAWFPAITAAFGAGGLAAALILHRQLTDRAEDGNDAAD